MAMAWLPHNLLFHAFADAPPPRSDNFNQGNGYDNIDLEEDSEDEPPERERTQGERVL